MCVDAAIDQAVGLEQPALEGFAAEIVHLGFEVGRLPLGDVAADVADPAAPSHRCLRELVVVVRPRPTT